MAYAFGTKSVWGGGGSASGSTIVPDSTTFTVALHDLIFVHAFVVDLTGTLTMSVADNFSNTYVQVGSTLRPTGNYTTALFICRDSNSAGACTPTVTISAATTGRSMQCGSISGLSTSLATSTNGGEALAITSGTDTLVSSLAVPSGQPAIVLGFQANVDNIAATAGTGMTAAPQGAAGYNPASYFGNSYLSIVHQRVTSTSAVGVKYSMAGTTTPDKASVFTLIVPETGAAPPASVHQPGVTMISLARGGR